MSNNFDYISEYLEKILKQDDAVYLLIVDGLMSYLIRDNGRNLTDEERARIINVGISEQNAVGIASGLALRGKKPYLVMFASFMATRAAEQVKLDLCYNNANVKLIGINAGFGRIAVAGYSHCTVEDIALFNALPNLKIFCPSNERCEIEKVMEWAYLNEGPAYIRLNCPFIDSTGAKYDVKMEKLSKVEDGQKTAIISTGICLELARKLSEGIKQISGNKPLIYSAHTIRPFDEQTICELIDQNVTIITLEEHAAGGLASIVSMVIAKYGKPVKFLPVFSETDQHNVVMYDLYNGWRKMLDIDHFYQKYVRLIYGSKSGFISKDVSINKKGAVEVALKIGKLTFFIKEERQKKKKGRLKYKYYLFGKRIL